MAVGCHSTAMALAVIVTGERAKPPSCGLWNGRRACPVSLLLCGDV